MKTPASCSSAALPPASDRQTARPKAAVLVSDANTRTPVECECEPFNLDHLPLKGRDGFPCGVVIIRARSGLSRVYLKFDENRANSVVP